MPTLYCDFENGNDNHGGTSFALLAQGTNGRISSATFSSAGASFPNDGSLIGQYLSIFNGTSYLTYKITAWVSSTSLTIAQISGGSTLVNQAVDRQYFIGGRWKSMTSGATGARLLPGDTVRIMGSPEPTSLGQDGVWTSQALQGTKNITGATNATPISITCTLHGYSTGDTVVISGVGGNTNANGTWEITSTDANTFTLDGSAGNANYTSGGTVRLRNNTRVMLTTAVTQNIACTGPRSAWTGGSLDTTLFKEHQYSDRLAVFTAFSTGKHSYYTLPTTLDLSGYQQVSFWIYMTNLPVAAGNAELRLCSDTIGDTAVNTIAIPAVAVVGRWQLVTVDTGANLGNSISSIALYINTNLSDSVTVNFYFSNIIACKASSAADSLTLTSLIGKNTTGETFWGIQSINGRRVMLDADTNATPITSTVRGYYGTSETVTTWKRETIKLGPAATSATALQTIQDSGTDGSPITFSGGWDRTNMSTQSLETWLDGVNGNGNGIEAGAQGFYTISIMAAVRFTRGFSLSSPAFSGVNLSLVAVNNNTGAGATTFSASGTANIQAMCANASSSFIGNSAGPQRVNLGQVISNGAAVSSVASGPNSTLTGNFYNTAGFGFQPGSTAGLKLLNCKFADNSSGAIQIIGTTAYGIIYLQNCLLSNSWDISQSGLDAYIYSHNHDQTANNHKIFASGGLISSATDQRKTASGISWKIQPTSTNRSSSFPLILTLAKVAVAANSLVTIKAWMRRDNSGLTMRLICKGGQIAGVANDVTASVTTTNAWEEETITFTPTEVGVVEITAEAWGGTTFSGWVDDMTITQA